MATYRTAPVGARDPLIPLTTAYALTGSGYPGRMLIESEIVYVVGGAGTSTIFVLRGQDGTDAASHPATAISDLNVPAAAPSFDEAAHDEHDHSEVPGLPEGGASTAAEVSYNNAESGLTAENVQAALDEVAAAPGGTPTLAEVLAEGNDTEGTDIAATADDADAKANTTATATGTGAAEAKADAVADVGDTNVTRTATSTEGNANADAVAISNGGGGAYANRTANAVEGDAEANSLATTADDDATANATAETTGAGLAAAMVKATGTAGSAHVRAEADATSARLGFFSATPVARPEVPAIPLAQDIVDALVALGLITQAAP